MLMSMPENQNNRDYFENIIALMPGHVYWKDMRGHILGCNDEQAKSVGLAAAQEMVGLTAYDTLNNKQADIITQNDKIVIKISKQLIVEEPAVINDKKAVFLSKKAPLRDHAGNTVGVIGVSFDITAAKEAERLKLEMAERKAQYLRAAAGSIAHELRTPLACIRMTAQFIAKFWHIFLSSYKLARNNQLDIAEIPNRSMLHLQGCLDNILQSTHNANAFINLILGNLQEEDEINTDNYHVCDMATVVNQCLAQYPFHESEKPLMQWCAENNFQFTGNEIYMNNVLNNLIKNAIYFIKAAGKGEMFIWLEKGEKYNALYFKDTGKGAPDEVVARLFENFYSKREGGTGLGLAFCKKIMKSFGGDIVAESVEGQYMQFKLSFPILKDARP